VGSVATAHADKPVTWDEWNEPDIPQFWPQSAASDSLFRETYYRTYKILRARIPAARIGGPTYRQYFRDRIVAFMDYCAAPAHPCEVNFLRWHELGPDIRGSRPASATRARASWPRPGTRR
jgi:hypothetical protein